MKINNPSISILGNGDEIRISITDNDASITFLEISITPKSFIRAIMERLSNSPCKATVYNLDKIGKKMEYKSLEFPMPIHGYYDREIVAEKEARRLCPEGWEPDIYFGSQNSFFYREQRLWAQITIRRWV